MQASQHIYQETWCIKVQPFIFPSSINRFGKKKSCAESGSLVSFSLWIDEEWNNCHLQQQGLVCSRHRTWVLPECRHCVTILLPFVCWLANSTCPTTGEHGFQVPLIPCTPDEIWISSFHMPSSFLGCVSVLLTVTATAEDTRSIYLGGKKENWLHVKFRALHLK